MKSVLWSISRPHTDNIKNGNKLDEIRKRIPKELTSETVNYIYETKANGGCGKVIGEFKVQNKVRIYAEIVNGVNDLLNTAFIMPALSNEELFTYLYDGKRNYGWALRISDLKIYDKPKPIMQFYKPCPIECKNCPGCEFYSNYTGTCMNNVDRPPQSYMYVEELE